MMFRRHLLVLSSAAALSLFTAASLAAQASRVPRWSVGMSGSVTVLDIEDVDDNLTVMSLPGGRNPLLALATLAAGPGGSSRIWVDRNIGDNWQVEFPVALSYLDADFLDDPITTVTFGIEPHYYFGSSVNSTRIFLGGGGNVDWISGGDESETFWSARGVGGVEIPIMSDLRIRTNVFYQHYFENEDELRPSMNAYGLELGANCYFGDEHEGVAYSPFNLRVGTDLSFERFDDDFFEDQNTTSFSLPSFYVGGFVPLSHSEQFQIGGEVAFERLSVSDENVTAWQWRPMVEYNLISNYVNRTGVRLQAFGAFRHFGASAGDEGGTQTGFGGGAAVTFPLAGHLGSVGLDWTHYQENEDIGLPTSSSFRVKFEMSHRLNF